MYFFIDTNSKMRTEITDLVVFRKKLLKLLKFLQGAHFNDSSLINTRKKDTSNV